LSGYLTPANSAPRATCFWEKQETLATASTKFVRLGNLENLISSLWFTRRCASP